jgi:CSLREA domain-containing protein
MRARTVLLLAATTMTLMIAARPAWANTFVVNSTDDDGDAAPAGVCNTGPFQVGTEPECTLRAAIQEANATSDPDDIKFSIGLGTVQTISPATLLPHVTHPVTIDGYTETGAAENTLTVGDDAKLRVRLNRPAGGAASGLFLNTNNSVVRGLSITGFSSGVGLVVNGDNNNIQGNFIGTGPAGTVKSANFDGVILQGNASDNLVGGTSPAARNVISGNGREGVRITTDNGQTGNLVKGNYIGTTRSGADDLGNGQAGVIVDSSDHTIGGTTRTAANIIAFNGQQGILVGDFFPQTTQGISILGNSIFSNGDLGIDLFPVGLTPNDGPGDLDTGTNNLQNFPVITSAKTGQQATTIKGTLEGVKSQGLAPGYIIQFFSSPEGTRDEGKKLIGKQVVVDANNDGIMPFTFKPNTTVKVGNFVTATATYDETHDTSEFSAPKKVRSP